MSKGHREQLGRRSEELNALAKSTAIKTEEGRALVTAMQRLTETLIHGEPVTEAVKRNHE